jgi:di/tripeptidase
MSSSSTPSSSPRPATSALGPSAPASKSPATSLETLAEWGAEALEAVVAIDSSSDETSTTIPSSEGQRRLSGALAERFSALGLESDTDAAANLIVRIPATAGRESSPAVALMVHMDTAHGTRAVPRLEVIPQWDGSRVPYPKNPRLQVDAAHYPLLEAFVGDDLLHGPGDFPFGLDDKLGMAELMALARLLVAEPDLPHGEILLVFRPDEEIGRMEAVKGLAAELAARGVRFGYTIDGLSPFEINVENFDATRARVRLGGRPLELAGPVRRLRIGLIGVSTHGATARSEGYLNSTLIFTRAVRGRPDVVALDFASDSLLECNAVVEVAVVADTAAGLDEAERSVLASFEREIAEARPRGADLRVISRVDGAGAAHDDAARRLVQLLSDFLGRQGPAPLLAEESDGYQGYTNPHRAVRDGDDLVLDFRIRDFNRGAVDARAEHLRACAVAAGAPIEIAPQYVNMGPVLARFPDLPRLAEEAARHAGVRAERRPIRGGTGVDPFLEKGIPVANLGTGYFAPESEKELTSRQNIARHVRWLAHLVQLF